MPPKSKPILSEQQLQQVEALAAYLTLEQTGSYLNYDPPEWQSILKKDLAVSRAYRRGEAKAIVVVAKEHLERARSGNADAIKHWLETKGRWAKTAPYNPNDTKDDGHNAPPAPTIIEIVAPHGYTATNKSDDKK